LRTLLFSSLYPNAVQPNFGVFVETRLRELLASQPVQATVVAPVPWFPFNNPRFGRYAQFAQVPRREQRHGIEVLHPRYPLLPKLGLSTAPALMAAACVPTLRRLLQQGPGFDVIDAHFYYPDGAAAALLARWFNKPLAVTARGSDVNLYGQMAWPRRAIRWTAQQAGASIGVSGALVKVLQQLGAPPERLHVMRNGVDLNRFQPLPPDTCRAQLGLRGGPIILSVGNLVELKGHALTIAAMPAIRQRFPAAQLVLVGQGPDRNALEAQAQALGLADAVLLAGPQPNTQLSTWYSAADVMVLASSREGWANVLLESMACGTPVAGTLVASRDAEGIAQAVLGLFDRRATWPTMRAAGRRFVEQERTWTNSAANYKPVFEALAQRARAQRA
jgi:glycosyltransferase involved in cell wall biosynthesis